MLQKELISTDLQTANSIIRFYIIYISGMAIRRIFGPHSHSDSLSESDKKNEFIRGFGF